MSRREDVERRLTVLEGRERARAYLEDERRHRDSLIPKPETQRGEIARLERVAEKDEEIGDLRLDIEGELLMRGVVEKWVENLLTEVGELRHKGAKYRHEIERRDEAEADAEKVAEFGREGAKELERLRKELRDFVKRARAADAMPNTGDTYHLRWAAASVEKILKED